MDKVSKRSNVRRKKSKGQKIDPEVFHAFMANYKRHAKRIFDWAYRILQDRQDAEDTLQEVCIAVQKHASQFRGQSQLSTWLYRVTFNAALQRLRRRKRHAALLPSCFTRNGRHVTPVVDWSSLSSVEDSTYRSELRHALVAALENLKPVDRCVVCLSEGEKFTDREIAQLLGLTLASVKSRLHRARLALRAELTVKLGFSSVLRFV